MRNPLQRPANLRGSKAYPAVSPPARQRLQRLALARAALHRPTTLLLDEPFAALDGDGRELLRTLIAEWRADNRAVLVVAHGSRLVADRTLVLADGVVV